MITEKSQKSQKVAENNETEYDNNNYKSMCNKLLEDNKEMRNTMKKTFDDSINANKELVMKALDNANQPKHITNNMTVNMYLSERCGNAINIRDFVNNLTVSLEQLIFTKEHGLVKGITNILVDSFKDVDQTVRPIHCLDSKRLSIKIKDDTWKSSTEDNDIIEEFITGMSNRHMGALSKWTNDHPGWLKDNAQEEDFYLDCLKKVGNPTWDRDENKKKLLTALANCKEFKLNRNFI